MEQLTITPHNIQSKRLFEVQDIERMGAQLITNHMRLIKRQATVPKPDKEPVLRSDRITVKIPQAEYNQRTAEARDFIQNKSMRILTESKDKSRRVVDQQLIEEEKPKIELLHKPFTHLQEHPINKMLRVYNEFIRLTFKSRDYNHDIDLAFYNHLNGLAKIIGLKLPPRRFLTMENFNKSSRSA